LEGEEMAEYELSTWQEAFNTGILDLWHEVFHAYQYDFKMNPEKLDAVTGHPDFHADGAVVGSPGVQKRRHRHKSPQSGGGLFQEQRKG
jgi:hypothetical protein